MCRKQQHFDLAAGDGSRYCVRNGLRTVIPDAAQAARATTQGGNVTIEFHCPHCDKLLKTPDQKAGVSAKCPGCGQRLTVPGPAREAADVDASFAASVPVSVPGPPTAPATAGGAEDPVAETEAGSPEDYKPCPMCGESIRKDARRCRYCGETVEGRTAWQPTAVEPGVILSRSWKLFGKNFGLLVGATLLMIVVLGGAMAVLGAPIGLFFNHPGVPPDTLEVVVVSAVYLALFAVSIYLQGGHNLMMLKIARGEPAQIADLFAGVQFFGRIFLGHLLLMVLAAVGFVLCIIPYFLVLMTFWPFALVIVDQNVGVIEAFRRSRQITADNLLTIFVLWLAVTGINLLVIPTCGIGVILSVPLMTTILAVAYCSMAGQTSPARS